MLWTNSAERLLGRWPQLTFDAQGRLSAVYGGSTCEHQIYSQTYLQPAAPKLSLPCGGDDHFAEATPQPDGESWLIVYGSESTVDSPGTLTVGSYDPFSASWTLSPRTFGARESYDGGAVLATDDRAYVVWGHGDRSTLGSFELQDGSPLTTIELERSAIYTESFALERLGDRTLIAGLDERGLWTASTDASELIAQSQIERAIVSDRRPNMVAAPGLGLVGVCYGVSGSGVAAAGGSGPYDEVAFVLLDRDAAPVAAPRVIRRMQNFGGCDVAWSGEEFLVAYWTIELPNSGRLEDGFESVVVGQPIRVSIEAGHRE